MEIKSPDKALAEGFRDLNIRDNIPHIVIGKKKEERKASSPYKQWKNYKKDEEVPQDMFENRIDKARNWGLLLAILVIGGYAAYRIIKFIWFGG